MTTADNRAGLRLNHAVNQLPVPHELHLRRGFGWGILVVLDHPDGQVPDLETQPFAASPSGLVLSVRHAQDVGPTVLDALGPDDPVPDAEVSIHVLIADEALENADHSAVLTLPGGTIAIGDADHWDVLDLPAGVWQARVTADPTDAPDTVAIVFSPLIRSNLTPCGSCSAPPPARATSAH